MPWQRTFFRAPAYTLLRSLKTPAVVAIAFAPAALPIPTSAAAVISSEVAAAVAVVDLAAADILAAAADESGAAAAVSVISAADDFSAIPPLQVNFLGDDILLWCLYAVVD